MIDRYNGVTRLTYERLVDTVKELREKTQDNTFNLEFGYRPRVFTITYSRTTEYNPLTTPGVIIKNATPASVIRQVDVFLRGFQHAYRQMIDNAIGAPHV